MISIHKKLFYEVFDKNIDTYFEFIKNINQEYSETIVDLRKSNTILEIRNNTHKIVGIISNLVSTRCDELLYICKTLLQNEKKTPIYLYMPHVENIIKYDKSILGL